MPKNNYVKSTRQKTKVIALSALLSALGVVILYIGSVFDVLDLSATAVSSVIIVFAVIEMRGITPLMIYAVTSILAVLLLPNKFTALLYIFFGGIYPIIKEKLERIHYVFSWMVKLSFFNVILFVLIFVSTRIMHIPDNQIEFTVPVFVFGNLLFVLYDFTLTQLITFYLHKLRRMLKLKNYFEK